MLYLVRWSFKLVGSGAIVGADLPGRTIIGRNNVIGHYAVIGVKCQDLKYKVCFLITLVLCWRICCFFWSVYSVAYSPLDSTTMKSWPFQGCTEVVLRM